MNTVYTELYEENVYDVKVNEVLSTGFDVTHNLGIIKFYPDYNVYTAIVGNDENDFTSFDGALNYIIDEYNNL